MKNIRLLTPSIAAKKGFYLLLIFGLLGTNIMALNPKKMSSQPFGFIENKGQIVDQNNLLNNDVLYLFSRSNFRVQLKQSSFSYEVIKTTITPREDEFTKTQMPYEPQLNDASFEAHRIDITLIGANPSPKIIASEKARSYANYYTIGTSDKGVLKVNNYNKILYKNIYPFIDMECVISEGKFKYNFIVHPKGNCNDIKLKYNGAESTALNAEGAIHIETSLGDFEERIPLSYQETKTNKINAVFKSLGDNTYGVNVGNYNHTLELVIDPLPWATFFGGSAAENVYGVNNDANGNIFTTGTTVSTSNIATLGAPQTTYGGGTFDAYLTKFSPTGAMVWCTYMGGTLADYGFSIGFDSLTTIAMGGFTLSTTGFASATGHQPTLAGLQDGFVVRLDATGARIWGTYYGGSAGNEALYGIVCDSGNIYAAGYTNTQTGTNIATVGSFQATYGTGAYDAFVVKFNSAGVRQWGTYYGGTTDDRAIGITKDAAGDIVFSGQTSSAGTMSTPGSHQPTFAGSISGYVAKFSSSGNRVWSTYYGGTQNTVTVTPVCDPSGNIYVGGYTGSTSGISTPGSHQTTLSGGPVSTAPYDGFIAKFSSIGVRQWGTYYGGADYDVAGFGLAVDSRSNVYLPGTTASASAIASPGAYKTTNSFGTPVTTSSPNGFDAFMLKMDSNGVRQWCTYYGALGMDNGRSVCVDSRGYSYWGLFGNSTSGIATPGAYQASNNGGDDCYIVGLNSKGNFDPDAYNNASIQALVSPTKFCAGNQSVQVRVKNNGINIINSVQINWDIDGVTQNPVLWNSILDTIGGVGKNDTVVTLSAAMFFQQNVTQTIRSWTSLPNNAIDTVPVDDSVTAVLKPGISGYYTIDPLSVDYPSFTSAVSDLNNYGVCGPVWFNVNAGASFNENPIILTRSGTSTDSIVFMKSGGGPNPMIYGKNGNGNADAIIALVGVSNVTFDGIDVIDSSASATTAQQMEYGYAVVNASATKGSTNIRIRNAKATLRRTNTATIGFVQATLNAASSLAGANHNNRYENIKVENSYNGILLQGTAAFPDSNNVITSAGTDTTVVGSSTANDIGNGTAIVYGIQAFEQKNVEISKTHVHNLTHTGTLLPSGIWINNISTTSNYGKAIVHSNFIYNLTRTSATATGGFTGIRIDVSPNATALVYNNVIHSMSTTNPASASATMLLRGIAHGVATANGSAEYYHNSVNIDYATINATSAAFWKGSTGAVTYRNNIFSSVVPAQTGVAKHYGSYINAGSVAYSSNNILWAPNANGFIGYAASDRSFLPVFAAAISPAAPSDGNEQGSSNADPAFNTTSDLTFIGATPAAQSAAEIVSFPVMFDISGSVRSITQPTVGAYESFYSQIDSSAPIITNVIATSSSTPTIYATIKDNNTNNLGDVKLWYRLGTTGAFTSLSPDSTPTSGSGTFKWGTSLNSLIIGSYQFYIAARDWSSPGKNIAVNPIHSSTFTGFDINDPANYLTNPDASVNVRNITKTGSLTAGTYTVGATGNYSNLTAVANLLNTSTLSGDVIFELQANYDGTTGETFPITFNPFYTAGGNWNVTVRPASGVTSRVTAGNPGSANPLIILNNIDRITFDGRPGGTGTNQEWTLRNSRAIATFAPTVRFINDATYNTLQYMRVEGMNTLATSGVIEFSTSTGTQGNDYNTIANNDIRNRSDTATTTATFCALGIYSAGTAAASNDSNTIISNKVFNWSTAGIHVTATGNGSGWNVSNNNFYMPINATTAQTAIRFEAGVNSIRNIIGGNVIGGNATGAAGTAWTNSVAGAWRGIVCNAGTSDSSYIQNNTIQNITLSGGTGTFAGVECTGGLLSIKNNTIGHTTTTNSIQSSQLGTVISIWLNNATIIAQVYNNTIANVTSTGSSTAVGHNAIRVASTNAAMPLIIRNNTIYNLKADNATVSVSTPSLAAIVSLSASTQQQILNNTIYTTSAGQNVNAAISNIGINISNASSSGIISGNHIYGLNNTTVNVGAQIIGIHLDLAASWNISNNMIALGYNVDSSAVITGIQDKSAATNNGIYYNTVVISGATVSAGSTATHAYRRTTTSVSNIRNNIFNNLRSGIGSHYATANSATTPATGWQANYNALNSSNVSQLGLWNGVATNFATWKITSDHDTSSVNTSPFTISSTDLHLTGTSVGDMQLAGKPIAGLTIDFDNQIRNVTAPYMGADEGAIPLPVKLIGIQATLINDNVLVQWQTAQEKNSSHFEVEKSFDGVTFTSIGKVKSAGNSTNIRTYSYTELNAANEKINTIFYRLKINDNNGSFTYSPIAHVTLNTFKNNGALVVYPNPFNNQLKVTAIENLTPTSWELKDFYGKTIKHQTQFNTTTTGEFMIDGMEQIAPGIYFITITTNDNNLHTIKLIKL